MREFFQQLGALLWRNILLKSRNKGQVFQELLFPIFFVVLLALIKSLIGVDSDPARSFPAYNINSTEFGQPFGKSAVIYVAPNTTQFEEWMKEIVYQLDGPPTFKMFDSEQDMEASYAVNYKDVQFGVIFNYSGNPHGYAIRTKFGKIPNSRDIFDFQKGICRQNENGTSTNNCEVNKYLESGFLLLQTAIDNAIMMDAGLPRYYIAARQMSVKMMAIDDYEPDTSVIQNSSSIYFVFSFCILASYLAINVVAEKDKKIKEGMLMMGLEPIAFWLSWFIVYMAMVVISSLIMITIIVVTDFFTQSNMLLLFFILLLYGASFISLGFMVTPFFNKARVAGAAAGFSTVFISLLYLVISEERDRGSFDSNLPVWSQWLLCLLCPLAFANCIDKAIYHDLHLNGIGFDSSLTYGEFPLWASMMMLAVDTILYALLTFYFEKVVPGSYGVTYKPYFFLQRSYWFPSKDNDDVEQIAITSKTTTPEDVEIVPSTMDHRLAMKIASLSKSFKSNKKEINAVEEFSLDIYEGQITCLLGHNGAGKTTLMNMLTGVSPPSSGRAFIGGLDITLASEMKQIRKRCGICPQHNIFHDMLSCKEHLRIFAAIKGIPSNLIENKVTKALQEVDLEQQGDTYAKDLSGGQKRKLSVAIALIGDPKLIFLDEPTAGMDPYSRRHLWSLLKKRKEGRVVLLTTHFMDEADILADRKAFIRKGKLRCCGSSLFLKNKFGIGYHLTILMEYGSNLERLSQFLTSVISGIQLLRSHGSEVVYIIPLNEIAKFSELFGDLDDSAASLGVKSYGVSMTTLEEVFLKLEEIDEAEDEEEQEGGDHKQNEETNGIEVHAENSDTSKKVAPHMASPEHKNDVVAHSHNGNGKEACIPSSSSEKGNFFYSFNRDQRRLWMHQFYILFKIRVLNIIRNKKVLLFQVILPICLVVAGLLIIKDRNTDYSTKPVALPIQLGYYANSSQAPSHFPLPGILILDSFGGAESTALMAGLDQFFTVNYFTSDLTNQSVTKPHFVGLELNGFTDMLMTSMTGLYNSSALHSLPTLVSLVSHSLIKTYGLSVSLNVTSFPWPSTEEEYTYDSNTLTAGILIGLGFVLIIPGFSAEVVRDRESKIRGQLRISGVSFNIYWGSIYAINFAIYLIPTILIIAIIIIIQIPGLTSQNAMTALFLLFICNIPFFCFLALVFSFFFEKADDCNTYLPFMLNVLAILPYIAVSTVDRVSSNELAVILHYIFCVIDPAYLVLGGFYFIARIKQFSPSYPDQKAEDSFLDPDKHTLIAIIMPIVHMIWMYWLLRILDLFSRGGSLQEALLFCFKSNQTKSVANKDEIKEEDSDVKEERTRIDSLISYWTEKYSSIRMKEINPKPEEPVAYIRQMRKCFEKRVETSFLSLSRKKKTKVAVRNLSFGVNKGEVLGLLGPNGAGKTTTLSMIIAELEPTCGKVMVGGRDVHSNSSNLTSLGYCPQHNSLWDNITLREHIICFAICKGYSHQQAENIVDFYLSSMHLESHKSKQAKALSGGTKRKLSYILSILGNPNLVLMDEPSTGMDPQSKRFLWDTISETFRGTSRGAILTTHSMEEADALCGRVGIMINGTLQCLGSTQHLKDKFGSGYLLEVKLSYIASSEIEESMNRLENHLKELFPGLETVERFMERAQYAIPKDDIKSLGLTFAILESCKVSHQLEEYNFSQSSLEQVFLQFAKKQVSEDDDEDEEVTGPSNSAMSNQLIPGE